MRSLKPFFKAIASSFNPNSYSHLSTREFRDTFAYLLSVMFVSFVLLILITLPSFGNIPTQINYELSKFTKFDISADIEMSEPIVLKDTDQLVVLDTTGQYENVSSETLLITKDWLYYTPFFKTKSYNLTELSDVTQNKDKYTLFIWVLVILIMPMLLLIIFFMYLAKYLLIMFGTILVAIVLLHILKYEIKLKHLIKVAIYGATPMIIIDISSIPIVNNWGIPYILFGFYFTIGIVMNAEKKIVHHR